MNKILDTQNTALLTAHKGRLVQRDIDQLLGICEFSLQDGHIDQGEAESILAWLDNHSACLDTWPANVLYERLRTILLDGVLDDDEQKDLLGIVMSISMPRTKAGITVSSTLPIDTPAPDIIFEQRNFCFTGVFDFGSRAQCQSVTESCGGIAVQGVTKNLNYLVIGGIGSETWKHSTGKEIYALQSSSEILRYMITE